MNRIGLTRGWAGGTALAALVWASASHAAVSGLSGPAFAFTARDGVISTPEANSIYCWGYANGNGLMQLPGPTMIVNQGEKVTVTLTNALPVHTSIVFPGQTGVEAAGGTWGILTREAPPGGTVTYSFVAREPGTYLYHSGTWPDMQVEMGLYGAIVVRPAGFDPMQPRAYGHPGSSYDVEYLFLQSEMDPRIHQAVRLGLLDEEAFTDWFPVYWFINGRCAPDTMADAGVQWLPTQPYNCMPMMHPGQKLLLRLVNAGRDPHPFHTHGNNFLVIAQDGRMLESAPGVSGPDLAYSDFTISTPPGGTHDAVFQWTGEKLGWDIYGHAPGDPMEPHEYAPDHGKPFPIILPDIKDVTIGAFYSGSPFLGTSAELPPGQGGYNPTAAYVFMWHSHNEKEMVNNDIFPGGLMTMLMVEPHGAMTMAREEGRGRK